jgi:hypothetical protein
MKRREFITLLGGAVWPLAAHAQQSRLPVVGVLRPNRKDVLETFAEPFRRYMKAVGWEEGRPPSKQTGSGCCEMMRSTFCATSSPASAPARSLTLQMQTLKVGDQPLCLPDAFAPVKGQVSRKRLYSPVSREMKDFNSRRSLPPIILSSGSTDFAEQWMIPLRSAQSLVVSHIEPVSDNLPSSRRSIVSNLSSRDSGRPPSEFSITKTLPSHLRSKLVGRSSAHALTAHRLIIDASNSSARAASLALFSVIIEGGRGGSI